MWVIFSKRDTLSGLINMTAANPDLPYSSGSMHPLVTPHYQSHRCHIFSVGWLVIFVSVTIGNISLQLHSDYLVRYNGPQLIYCH